MHLTLQTAQVHSDCSQKYVDLRYVSCTPVLYCTLTIHNTGISQLRQYIEKIGGILQLFKRCLNRAAATNKLPLELLTRVFEDIQVQRSSKARFPHPFALRRSHNFSKVVRGGRDFLGTTYYAYLQLLARHHTIYSVSLELYFSATENGFTSVQPTLNQNRQMKNTTPGSLNAS